MSAQDILMALAPECIPLSPRLVALLADSASQLDPAVFGPTMDRAVALLTLHSIALSKRGIDGPAGPITSETEKTLSRSYAAPAQIITDLDTTSWGLEFKRLRRSRILGMRTRMG